MSIISLKNINKKFGDHIIFEDYNLEIEKGEFVSIMGKSGQGKTTLLNMIGLLEKPDYGDIEICGAKNPKFDSHNGMMLLRKHISYLFQNYGLIDTETVDYNLGLVLKFSGYSKSEANEKISETLEKVGLKGFEKKKIYQLSGGEQQRVAIAKIFLKPSEIVLADEPTGSLDAENETVIMNMIKELNQQGRTVVVVTHSKAVMNFATRHIELK